MIKEYSKLGYEVFANYKGYQRPEAIGNFVPDFVAKKGNQIIIVEIATKRDLLSQSKKIEHLSKYADKKENVRFDLILTNPKPRLSRREKEISNEILLKEIQKHLLEGSKELYKKGHYESSYLMLSILLENVLRKFAIKNKVVDIHRKISIMQLISLLLENGKISKNNFASIIKFLKYRDKIIHESYKIDEQTLREYINFVSYFIKRA